MKNKMTRRSWVKSSLAALASLAAANKGGNTTGINLNKGENIAIRMNISLLYSVVIKSMAKRKV